MFLFIEHFKRYIIIDYLEENYLEILKTEHYIPIILVEYIPRNYLKSGNIISQIKENNRSISNKEFKYCENYDILRLIEFVEDCPEHKDLVKPCVLKYKNSVSLIFSRLSTKWGTRGDPYFWGYLEEIFLDYSFPMELDIFERIIENEYFKLSGKKLGEDAYIEQFSHGGMSSGRVSEYWTYTGIPLLKYRLIQSNNEYYLKNNELSKIIENPETVIQTKSRNLEKIILEYDFDEYNHCQY